MIGAVREIRERDRGVNIAELFDAVVENPLGDVPREIARHGVLISDQELAVERDDNPLTFKRDRFASSRA